MNDYSYLAKACSNLKERCKPVVLVTGCFDVIHLGHALLLEFASEHGIVFVGVNSDQSIKQLKGDSRPINNQSDRMELLEHLAAVYVSFIIDETTVTNAILKIKPSAWIKGADYTLETLNQEERKAAESVGTKIVFAPKVEGYSSTSIIERMKA